MCKWKTPALTKIQQSLLVIGQGRGQGHFQRDL